MYPAWALPRTTPADWARAVTEPLTAPRAEPPTQAASATARNAATTHGASASDGSTTRSSRRSPTRWAPCSPSRRAAAPRTRPRATTLALLDELPVAAAGLEPSIRCRGRRTARSPRRRARRPVQSTWTFSSLGCGRWRRTPGRPRPCGQHVDRGLGLLLGAPGEERQDAVVAVHPVAGSRKPPCRARRAVRRPPSPPGSRPPSPRGSAPWSPPPWACRSRTRTPVRAGVSSPTMPPSGPASRPTATTGRRRRARDATSTPTTTRASSGKGWLRAAVRQNVEATEGGERQRFPHGGSVTGT